MDILIGCDPEIFVTKNGQLISAHGLVPGDKKNPHPVKHGAVQVDGMALEFNIDPVGNKKDWHRNIDAVMGQMKGMVGDGYEFAIQPTAHFGRELIEQQPEEAQALGCEADYNAYTGTENPRPNSDVPFRTASGHVHIGWTQDMDPHDPEHFEACCMLTKQLDVSLAVPSLLWDRDDERRTLYGALGAFRPKPYGMEYRVLSNSWLTHKELISYVFNTTKNSVNQLLAGGRWYEHSMARERFEEANPAVAWDYFAMYGDQDAYDYLWSMYKAWYNEWEKAPKKSARILVDVGFDDIEDENLDFDEDDRDDVDDFAIAPPPPPPLPRGIRAGEVVNVGIVQPQQRVDEAAPRAEVDVFDPQWLIDNGLGRGRF